jgi:hypothetical protein
MGIQGRVDLSALLMPQAFQAQLPAPPQPVGTALVRVFFRLPCMSIEHCS